MQRPAFEVWTFTSDPPGATVRVADAASGELVLRLQTPAVSELDAGRYRVTFEKEGYLDPSSGEDLEVLGGVAPQVLNRQLVKDAGTVTFTGDVDALETLLHHVLDKVMYDLGLGNVEICTPRCPTALDQVLERTIPDRRQLRSDDHMMVRINDVGAFLRRITPWVKNP